MVRVVWEGASEESTIEVCGKSVGGKMVRVVGRRREGEEGKEEKARRKSKRKDEES
jgi:hypothetical protein